MANTHVSDNNTDKLYLASGQFTSTIKSSVGIGAIDTEVNSIEWDGTNAIWVGGGDLKLYLQSGEYTSTLKTSEDITAVDATPGGATSDLAVNTPWCGREGNKLYLQSGQFTSTIKTSLSIGGYEAGPSGISSDNVDTIFIGYGADKLYDMSGQFSSTIKDSEGIGGTASWPMDITWDGTNTPWCESITDVKLHLQSGRFTSTIKTSIATPSGGSATRGIGSSDAALRFGVEDVTILPDAQALTLTQEGASAYSPVITDTFMSGRAGQSLFYLSGQYTTTIKTSLFTDGFPRGICWDGTNTAVADEWPTQLTLQSGIMSSVVKDSLTVSGVDGFPRGISSNETGEDTPWCGDGDNKLYLQSGQFTSTMKTSEAIGSVDTFPSDISWDGTNTPWVGSDARKLYLQSGQFTSTLKTSEAVGSIDTIPTGISWDGTNTPWSGDTANKLYLTSGQFTSTLKTSITVTSVDTEPHAVDTANYIARLGVGFTTVTPSEISMTLAQETPTYIAQLNNTETPAAQAITMALPVPTAGPIIEITPSEISMTLAQETPTVIIQMDMAFTVSTLTLALTQETPLVSSNTEDVLIGAALELTLAQPAPTAEAEINVTVLPDECTMTLAAVDPTITMSFDTPVPIGAEITMALATVDPYIGLDETRIFVDEFALALTQETPLAGAMVGVTPATLSITSDVVSPWAPATQLEAALPMMTLEAESFGRWNTGEYPAFETTLLLLTLEATGISGYVANLSSALPVLTLDIRVGIKVDTALPLMTLEASGTTSDIGSLTKPLPLFTLEATGTNVINGNFDNSLPVFELEISLLRGGIHSFAATLPLVSLEAHGTAGGTGGVFESSIPMITAAATGYSSENGDFSNDLSLMTLEAFMTSYENRFI